VTVRLPLGDLLALAILEHGPDSGSALARTVNTRKQAVLDELRTSSRFEQLGRGRGSRWRLAAMPWEPMGTQDGERQGIDDPLALKDRLGTLEHRIAELESHAVEGDCGR
jgi:hypothetical protein